VGLPNAGKSTVFNALCAGHAQTAKYPFCTIEPNVGHIVVPDERFEKICQTIGAAKIQPASVEFVDVAGLVEGASEGAGMGNQFLSYIREVDLLLHIVRCFKDADIPTGTGRLEPVPSEDVKVVNLELVLADMDVISRRRQKLEKLAMRGDKEAGEELEVLKKAEGLLDEGGLLASAEWTEHEREYLSGLNLITLKPMIYVANVGEGDEELAEEVAQIAGREGAPFLKVCGKLEAELAELEDEERAAFEKEMGIEGDALVRLIHTCCESLGLITFYTVTHDNAGAWLVDGGTSAYEAAGKIHSDIQAGFIKAEVLPWRVLLECGSFQAAREKGLTQIQGKDYVVQDGDVIHFHFRV